jgi:hypothetical protein
MRVAVIFKEPHSHVPPFGVMGTMVLLPVTPDPPVHESGPS